jgi:hypothetical protein
MSMRILETEQDLEDHWGERVTLAGYYQTMLLPTGKRPGSPLIESGRIQIAVGSRLLALEVQKAGYRSESEKVQFLNRRVKITGTIREWVQLWGTPEEQAIVMPAIMEIQSIEID